MTSSLSPARPPKADLDVGKLLLSGTSDNAVLSSQIQKLITGSTVETTLDGASTLTLTVTDWSRKLLNSPILTGPCQVTFDGEDWMLTKVAKQGTVLTLTFEDMAVHWLRQYRKAKKANRANTTRAQFVQSMVQEVTEVKIPFMCPEINDKQPIAKPKAQVRVGTQRWLT